MPGFADVSGDAFFSGLIGNRKTEFVGVLGDPAGGGAGGEARKIRIPYQTEVHDRAELVLGVAGARRPSRGGAVSILADPVVEGCHLGGVGTIGRDYRKIEAGVFRGAKELKEVRENTGAKILVSRDGDTADLGETGGNVTFRQSVDLVDMGENHITDDRKDDLAGVEGVLCSQDASLRYFSGRNRRKQFPRLFSDDFLGRGESLADSQSQQEEIPQDRKKMF